jgi:hypothetical protein
MTNPEGGYGKGDLMEPGTSKGEYIWEGTAPLDALEYLSVHQPDIEDPYGAIERE